MDEFAQHRDRLLPGGGVRQGDGVPHAKAHAEMSRTTHDERRPGQKCCFHNFYFALQSVRLNAGKDVQKISYFFRVCWTMSSRRSR
jgi:hypothetical protein